MGSSVEYDLPICFLHEVAIGGSGVFPPKTPWQAQEFGHLFIYWIVYEPRQEVVSKKNIYAIIIREREKKYFGRRLRACSGHGASRPHCAGCKRG